jgi:uncharacterized protein YjaZ
MKVNRIFSADIYEKIIYANQEKKADIFRYDLMQPFERKWACYQVPMKAKVPGGYDVVMASEMLGILPPRLIDDSWSEKVDLIKSEKLWNLCQTSIERSFKYFIDKGITLYVEDYLYTILLADPASIYTKLSDGYSGDGGIPGYICYNIT